MVKFTLRGATFDASLAVAPSILRVMAFLDKSKLGELWRTRDLAVDAKVAIEKNAAHPALRDYRACAPEHRRWLLWGSKKTIQAFRKEFPTK